MSFFDAPRGNYPRSWSEYSLDYQIFFIWEISLMALFMLSGTLLKLVPALLLEGALAIWFLFLLGVAIHNRRQKDWRWRGLTSGDWIKAGIGAALMIAFLYVFSQGLWPLKSMTLPMFLFALSLTVFNILASVRVVQLSGDDFMQSCGDIDPSAKPADDDSGYFAEPKWKRTVRVAFSAYFILAWLQMMGFFYLHQKFDREGSSAPTATQTEFFNEHGHRIYVTPDQMKIDDILSTLSIVGVLSAVLGGFFIHFVVGVPLFRNMPESRGLFGGSRDQS